MHGIESKLLLAAMKFYESLGYEPLTTPLLVDKDIIELTASTEKNPRKHLDKYYANNIKQSFYQLIKDGFKPNGSYMLITPCERDKFEDDTHLSVFLKLDLISTLKSDWDLMKDVSDFLYQESIGHMIKDTATGYALVVKGVEVGSYATDNLYNEGPITIGTGLALPIISQATNVAWYNTKI